MKKVMISAIAILTILLVILFTMWKNTTKENVSLTEQNAELITKMNQIQETLKEKEELIKQQDKKYQEILSSIEYNECENLPVSATLVEAAKELQK